MKTKDKVVLNRDRVKQGDFVNQVKTGAILSYVNIIINICTGLIYTPFMMRTLGRVWSICPDWIGGGISQHIGYGVG